MLSQHSSLPRLWKQLLIVIKAYWTSKAEITWTFQGGKTIARLQTIPLFSHQSISMKQCTPKKCQGYLLISSKRTSRYECIPIEFFEENTQVVLSYFGTPWKRLEMCRLWCMNRIVLLEDESTSIKMIIGFSASDIPMKHMFAIILNVNHTLDVSFR